MPTVLDEQKRAFLPFLQRADEIATVDPKVAYYCRVYALEQAIPIPNKEPEITGVLHALLAQLEKVKPTLNLGPDDQAYCENFALTVFTRAEKVDRAGRADKNTAKAFYAASIFIEILNQFGELPPDMVDVQRYAAWKAADIGKALREGRQPTPGPPGAAPLPDGVGEATSSDLDLPSAPGTQPAAPPVQGAGPPPGPVHSVSYQGPRDPPPGPTLPRSETLPSPRAAPPGHRPPRFSAGSKVYYRGGEGDGQPCRGTVAKIEPKPDGQPGVMYRVALKTQFVACEERELAADFEEGGRVLLHLPERGPMPCTVRNIDTSTWPPSYLITTHDNRTLEASDEALSPDPQGMPPPPPPPQGPPSPASGPPRAHPPPPAAPSPRAPPPPVAPSPPAPVAYPAPAPPAASAGTPAPTYSVQPGNKPDLLSITEAQKLAKFAASSLSFEDVNTAVDYLNEALRLLTVPGAKPKDTHARPGRR